jgi:hypothetical protein
VPTVILDVDIRPIVIVHVPTTAHRVPTKPTIAIVTVLAIVFGQILLLKLMWNLFKIHWA